MDITINCQVSISKKLRALIGNEETRLTLVTDRLNDGKASAKIILSLENVGQSDIDELMNKETSIMLTPTDIMAGIPDSVGVGNIFSSSASSANEGEESDQRNPIDRIAATKAPVRKADRKYAIKQKNEIEKETPKQFNEVKKPEFKKFITDLSQLVEAIKASESKEYGVDINTIQDPRKRAIALEEKEKAEAIDYPALVVNEKCANLTINDLGINLMLNVPFNLANVSAKRLAASMDLKAMFRAGMLKFISPDEVQDYIEKAEQILHKPGLETFSRHEDAEASIEGRMGDIEQVEIGSSDLMRPTEQESLAMNLTSRAFTQPEEGVRRSAHGISSQRASRTVPNEEKQSASGLKSIRRTGIEYR